MLIWQGEGFDKVPQYYINQSVFGTMKNQEGEGGQKYVKPGYTGL